MHFFLKEAIDIALLSLSETSFQFLGVLKAKLWPKCLTKFEKEMILKILLNKHGTLTMEPKGNQVFTPKKPVKFHACV